MTETEAAVTCQCGQVMKANHKGARYCDNCDFNQPQQVLGMSRRLTSSDIRFNMFWMLQENEYVDNTVGTPNIEESGDEAANG
jgi:hypothetical protein